MVRERGEGEVWLGREGSRWSLSQNLSLLLIHLITCKQFSVP